MGARCLLVWLLGYDFCLRVWGCVGVTRLLFSLWLISLLGVGLWLGVGAIAHVDFGVVRLVI